VISTEHPVTLLQGDVVDALPLIPDNSIDACITDPPYALSMGGGTAGWDSMGPAAFARFCEGWGRDLARAVKPGGWVLAFGSGRTWHRLTQGLEDAGLDIIDSINWVYPSGFMRSINIPERLARAGSAERARQLAGRGSSLHSRHEPAVLARVKPRGGLLAVVAEHGTGTLGIGDQAGGQRGDVPNMIVQHSPFCGSEEDGLECVVGCPVPQFGANLEYFPTFRFDGKPSKDERPKIRVEAGQGTAKLTNLGQVQVFSCTVCGVLTQSYMGSGGTYATKPHPVCSHDSYEPLKGNWSTQIAHNTVKPLSLMRFLVRLLTVPGQKVLEPFAGSGSTMEACVLEGRQVVGVERDPTFADLCRVRLKRQGCYLSE
jgi:DNA modification methylase